MKPLTNYNDLKYGNINQDSTTYLEKSNIFTEFFTELSQYSYPTFDKAIAEVKYLHKLHDDMKRVPSQQYKDFMILADKNIEQLLTQELVTLGISYNKAFFNPIQDQLGALIMQLKNYYNRPRPYQVAYYAGLTDFHPFGTITGNTPAFPSGHTCQAVFICRILAFYHPEKLKQLTKLGLRIGKSREFLGVHYPSDTEFGIYMANYLASHSKIQGKFFNQNSKLQIFNNHIKKQQNESEY